MSMFRKALSVTAVALVTLTFVPSHLAAAEREAPAGVRVSASVLDWFSGTWSELAAWFARDVVPPPPAKADPTIDGGCEIDPNGCPKGQ
jgi:hypothetical protein